MKDMKKTFITLIIYLFLPALCLKLCQWIFNFTYDRTNLYHIAWYNIIADFVLMILVVLLSIDIFKKNKPLKGDGNESKVETYITTIIKCAAVFYLVKIGSTFIVAIITQIFGLNSISYNQELLEQIFRCAPILTALTGAICAPIVEELIFRGAIKRVIKNKKVFIIVSGLTFGLLHVLRYISPVFCILIAGILIDIIFESKLDKNRKFKLYVLTIVVMLFVSILSVHIVSGSFYNVLLNINFSEAINSISYIVIGLYLAYIYAKYDNIYINIWCHIINNALAYIFLFTTLIK